jgi:hypothetical protein
MSHHTKHVLTVYSKIHVNAVQVKEQDFFPQAMLDIYEDAFKKRAAGKGMFSTLVETYVPLTRSTRRYREGVALSIPQRVDSRSNRTLLGNLWMGSRRRAEGYRRSQWYAQEGFGRNALEGTECI